MTQVLSVRKIAAAPGAELRRVEAPRLGPTEVRIRVRAASVCGTDKHIYNWDAWAQSRVRPPITFGHECCGDVVEIGELVRTVQLGDFVSVETHVPCMTCRLCRTGSMHICQNLKILGVDTEGCFAQQVVIPEVCAWKNPPDMDPQVAAIQEPFGNAVYCVHEAKVGARTVAIMGDGPIACFATAIAKAQGAAFVAVTGLSPARLEIAKTMGADRVVNAGTEDAGAVLREISGGEGFDCVLEMAGAVATVRQGLEALRKGGTFIAFGIPTGEIPVDYTNAIVFKEATIRGVNGRRMFETWYQTRALITSGLVDPRPVITHSYPLEQFEKAFETLNDPTGTAGKIVLLPS
jgi:threonine 3-dehydrogenase